MIIDGNPIGSTNCTDCDDNDVNLIFNVENVGNGYGLVKGITGNTAYFKSLVAGSNISLVQNADTISIFSSGGTGGSFSGVTQANFNFYTGTTAPATYLTKSSFNTYSGLTLANINTRLLKTTFNTYTGATAPSTFQSKSSIVTLTGTTLPNTYASKSAFLTFTGTTVPTTYLSKIAFNTYSASTLTSINSKLSTSTFNSYSGATATSIGLKKNIANSSPTSITTSGSLTINGVSGSLLTLDCGNREESKFKFSGNTTSITIALDNFPEGAYAILTVERSTNVNISVRFKNKTYLLSNTQLINNGKDALIVRGRSSGKTVAVFGFYSAGEAGAVDNQSSPSTTNLVNQLKFVEDTSL